MADANKTVELDSTRRRRWRILDKDDFLPDGPLHRRKGCLASMVMFVFIALGTICSGIISLVPGCRLTFNKPEVVTPESQLEVQPLTSQELGSQPMTQNSNKPPRVRTEVLRNTDGQILQSKSQGEGLSINWQTAHQPNGARLEDVLDAALTRMQALQASPQGGDALARHVYSLDKLLNELRESGFAESGLFGTPQGGPGFVTPDDSVGNVGASEK